MFSTINGRRSQNQEEEEESEEMATRNHPAVNGQQRGVALPAGKPKAADGHGNAKNPKALEDIGNFVNLRITTDGKAITRPRTTSIGAQLLANAQAVAAANKNVLNQVNLPANGAAKKKPAIKNPKPEVANSSTSVLSSRSKIACGIVDIDAADAENELSMVEYVEDPYKFYKDHEKVCSPQDYMSSQVEINAKMIAILFF